nr:DUF350 domain-containing protein [Desulfobacterales bacterium]
MNFISEYLSIADAFDCIDFAGLAYLCVIFIILWSGKLINDLFTSYSIDKELTSRDNKALAVSYVGYLIAQGIIVLEILKGPEESNLLSDLALIIFWSLIGILLLNLSRYINGKLIFNKFSSRKEIIDDQNVGMGVIQFGSYIGTAFILQAIIAGESEGLLPDLYGTVIFFIIGQLGFILFSIIYEKIVAYDLHDEIEKDNIAAGVSFGTTMVAIGILMSHSIMITNSIPAFCVWFINGMVLIVISRFIVDKIILP